MKDVIISVAVILVIMIVTICASYYFVTNYNIDKSEGRRLNYSSIVK